MPESDQTTVGQPVWTLDARSSVFLDVLTDYFDMSDPQVRRVIVSAHAALLRTLRVKGIEYAALRSALVPQGDRLERGFVFDSARVESNRYGDEVAERLIPLLNRDTTCSLLVGDLIAKDQDSAREVLKRYVPLYKPSEIADTSQLYCVYVNNLTEAMAEVLHQGLTPYGAYLGWADTTFSSPMKNWLSATLVARYVKAREMFLCPHEEDVPNNDDYNVPGWPLEKHGYAYRSVQSTYFDLFLSYKIERAVYAGFESDTRFSLSAISDSPMNISNFSVFVEEAKAEYLRSEKAGSLRRAALEKATRRGLEDAIRSRLDHNYIYNLRFLDEHGVALFNIMLEITNPSNPRVVRLTAALAYQPQDRILRVVTLF